jgi:hypothetical protein
LVPTSIVDKRGRQTTVHKKLLPAGGAGTSLPSPGASAPKPAQAIDWKRTSSEEAVKLAQAVTPTLSDPTRLWQNFEFYTGMLNSHHNVEARAMFEKHEVLGTLRDAWLDMHGMALMADRDQYTKIKGSDGYNAFIKARDNLLEAHRKPDPSKNKSSASKDDSGVSRGPNPFNALRERKERKDREQKQQTNVRVAADLLLSSDDSDDIVKSLKKPEVLAKASDLVDMLSGDDTDNEAVRNFVRGLMRDDNEGGHKLLNAMYAHKDYIASNPGHLGILIEVADHLKQNESDYQQEDGTMPHLEGYVEAFTNDMTNRMLALGETRMENIPLKPYLDRAIRSYNKQRVNSVQ